MKKLIYILTLLIFSNIQAQCWFSKLTDDIKTGSAEFKAFIKNNEEGYAAYRILYNARGANSAFKTDLAVLEKVAQMKRNAVFMDRIGGDEGLQAIIKNNVRAPCKSCTGGSAYLKHMDEYLEDVSYFVTNFHHVNDATRLIRELKNGAQNTLEGGAFAVRVFKENPNGLFNVQNVAEIDLRFSEEVLNRFDVKFVNGFGEFKSYQAANINNVSVGQLKQYISDPNMVTLDNLHYLFDKRKLLSQYGTGTFETAELALAAVKERMKNIFISNAADLFNANPNLFRQFDRIGGGKIRNAADLENLLKDSTFSISHPMFNFVKVK